MPSPLVTVPVRVDFNAGDAVGIDHHAGVISTSYNREGRHHDV